MSPLSFHLGCWCKLFCNFVILLLLFAKRDRCRFPPISYLSMGLRVSGGSQYIRVSNVCTLVLNKKWVLGGGGSPSWATMPHILLLLSPREIGAGPPKKISSLTTFIFPTFLDSYAYKDPRGVFQHRLAINRHSSRSGKDEDGDRVGTVVEDASQ